MNGKPVPSFLALALLTTKPSVLSCCCPPVTKPKAPGQSGCLCPARHPGSYQTPRVDTKASDAFEFEIPALTLLRGCAGPQAALWQDQAGSSGLGAGRGPPGAPAVSPVQFLTPPPG